MNFATLDLNLLRVLDAIFAEGSTVRAGARLGLSQPAVSGALSRLRHALGDPLFVRQGNRLVPTVYAETLRDGLRAELERLEALLAPAGAFDPAAASGVFRIAGSDFFAELLLPPLADLLHRTAPGLRVQLVDLVPEDYIQSLERYDADLALIPDAGLPDWVARAPLFRSPFVVIARRSNPAVAGLGDGEVMPVDTFCAQSHVLFSPEGKLSSMGDAALARIGRSRRVVMTMPVFSGVCRSVSASDLIALVPEQLARMLAPELGLRIFRAPVDVAPPLIVGIWHRRADRAPMASWMRARIFDLLKPLDASP